MSDGDKESKGEKEEQVEIEGKSHLNKNRKSGGNIKNKKQSRGLCFVFWWPREAGHQFRWQRNCKGKGHETESSRSGM